jgi:urease accessory protein
MTALVTGIVRESALTGVLRLTTTRRADGRTVATGHFHSGALRVLRPHYSNGSGQALVTIVNPGGGFLGADRYEVEYDGGPGTSALLTTQSATKIYRTPQGPARQDQRIRLAAGAVLELVPDQLIAYRDAQFIQHTDVELDPEASFFAAEIVTPGWSPDGQPFTYGKVRLQTRIRRGGKLLLRDNLVLCPGHSSPSGIGWLEGRTHCASLVAAGPGIDAGILGLVREAAAGDGHTGVHAGVSLMDGPALVLRALADRTEPLAALVARVGAALRHQIAGRGPWDLRKY